MTQVKPSFNGFVKWLGQQDPTEEYSPQNPNICALGRYYKSLGLKPVTQIYDVAAELNVDYEKLVSIVTSLYPIMTFGESLKKVNELFPEIKKREKK